ncbi:MAG: hypothetical protein KTR29_01580, partial [Rhodothermaceae bacterium]|nr:hypothetical protein [Rhodothermaceae bacterium]
MRTISTPQSSSIQQTLEAPPDSIQVTDSLQDQVVSPDTVSASADSSATITDVVGDISREVSETGQLILTGQWQEVINEFYQGMTSIFVGFIPKLLSATFVLLLFYVLYRLTRNVLKNILSRSKFVDAGLEGLLMKTLSVVGWVFIGIMVLAQFGINVTA